MNKKILTVRTPSGLSGDMLVTGLARMTDLGQSGLDDLISDIGLSQLDGCLELTPVLVNHLSGWRAVITLADEKTDRTYRDIKKLISNSHLTATTKGLAEAAFAYLVEAESVVHAVAPEMVTFHEIGALDSILDVLLSSALFDRIGADRFLCSPLPICDGTIDCRHGRLSAPSPASLRLLKGIPVYGVNSFGETVTPTAVALLRAFGAVFGPWPPIVIERVDRIYGNRVLPELPNGAIFAIGTAHVFPPPSLDNDESFL